MERFSKPVIRVATDAGQRVSDDPLPGDEVAQETPVRYCELTAMLQDGIDLVAKLPEDTAFDRGAVIMLREDGEGNSFTFSISESVSLTYLLGVIEIMKADIIEQLRDESVISDADETPAP